MEYTNIYGTIQDLSVTKPTIQSYGLSYDDDAKQLSLTRGDGRKFLLLVSRNPITHLPKDGVTYNVGDFICDCKVEYKGTNELISLADLESGQWYVKAIEFNGFASVEKYLTSDADDNPISIMVFAISDSIFSEEFDESFG